MVAVWPTYTVGSNKGGCVANMYKVIMYMYILYHDCCFNMCPHICQENSISGQSHLYLTKPTRARADTGGGGRIWILRADMMAHMNIAMP